MTEQEIREKLKVGSKVRDKSWKIVRDYINVEWLRICQGFILIAGEGSNGTPDMSEIDYDNLIILPDESEKKYHYIFHIKNHSSLGNSICKLSVLLSDNHLTHYAKYVDCMLPTGELDESKLIEVKR